VRLGPGDYHFGKAVRLQAGYKARAPQVRARSGGRVAADAARGDLLFVDAFRDKVIAHGGGTAL